MRREERPHDPSEGTSELEAIETQWTRLWESEGALGRPERIHRRVELRIMRPYIEALPRGSRILDGGLWHVGELTSSSLRASDGSLAKSRL